MPSGTMAQQIALRIWSDRRGSPTVAFHPTCHLEIHEQKGYQLLHGLHGRLVGDPDRLITLADLEAIAEPVAALLLELPQREIGGQLPEWAELEAQTALGAERGIALHLDGARLWESGPFYERDARGDRRPVRQRLRLVLQGSRRAGRGRAGGRRASSWPRPACGSAGTAETW